MLPGVSASYWTGFFPAVVVLGFGLALTVAPLTTTVMSAVERSHAGIASGINNAVSDTAGLLAIAVFGLAMSHAFAIGLDRRMAAASIPEPVRMEMDRQETKLAAIEIPASADVATRALLKQAVDDAFLSGFRLVMLISSILALLAAACAWLALAPGARRRGDSV
jgi:hypothetical protein